MRLGGRKTWIAIALLLLAGGAAYYLGWHAWPQYQYRAARDALARRDFQEATQRLQKFLDVRPDDFMARLLLAQTLRRRGEIDEAIEQLRICKQRDDRDESLNQEYRLLQVQRGDLTQAEELLSSYYEKPDGPNAKLVLEAVIQGSQKSLRAAFGLGLTQPGGAATPVVQRTQRAVAAWLEHYPSSYDQAQGLVWRALLHGFTHDHQNAVKDMRRAVELDPGLFEARMHLAMVLTHESPAEAAKHFEELRRGHPDNKDICFALAAARRALGELPQAEKLIDELLAAEPDHSDYLVERGYIAMNSGQAPQAEVWLRRAVSLYPQSPEAHLALSGCLNLLGQEAEATRFRDKGLELSRAQKRHQEELLRNQKVVTGP